MCDRNELGRVIVQCPRYHAGAAQAGHRADHDDLGLLQEGHPRSCYQAPVSNLIIVTSPFNCTLVLSEKTEISGAQHEKLFIFKSTRDTLPAHDGESFTRTLVSVCKEHGGALPILLIEK